MIKNPLFICFLVDHVARLMAMEGPILCRAVMQAKLPVTMISNSLTKSGQLGTAFLGSVCKYRNITRLISPIYQPAQKNFAPVCGSFSSSSDGNGYMAGNFSESDEDYVNSTVLEAGTLPLFCFFLFEFCALMHSIFTKLYSVITLNFHNHTLCFLGEMNCLWHH